MPDTIGIAKAYRGTNCVQTVTLETGQTVEESNGVVQGCAGEPETPVLISGIGGLSDGLTSGQHSAYDEGKAPLVLSGLDGAMRWVGIVGRLNTSACFEVTFFEPDTGAWLEGQQIHLTSGVLLDLAPTFGKPTYPEDAFPLRRDDHLCLDDQGRVTSVFVWLPY